MHVTQLKVAVAALCAITILLLVVIGVLLFLRSLNSQYTHQLRATFRLQDECKVDPSIFTFEECADTVGITSAQLAALRSRGVVDFESVLCPPLCSSGDGDSTVDDGELLRRLEYLKDIARKRN